MSQIAPHPERHMRTRCGAMVEKGHVGYPCSREQGHMGIPADDPEPCYAVEVPASLRTWQAWQIRQQQRVAAPPPEYITQSLDAAAQLAAVHAQQAPPEHPAVMEGHAPVITDIVQGEFLAQVFVKHCEDIVAHSEHIWQPEGVDHYCDGTGVRPEDLAPSDEVRGFLTRQFADCGDVCREALAHNVANPECVLFAQAHQYTHHYAINEGPVEPFEPTKQREGDQILPTGDADYYLDDQSRVIADIEARRKVGIERYGQAHVPFNGRNTMLDSYEETLDFLVYQRSLLRMREATKAEVTAVVAKVFSDNPEVWDHDLLTEAIVNRLGDWALMQRVEQSG